MNNVLSVSAKDAELNVEERQVIAMDYISSLPMVDHVIDDLL